MMSMPTSSLQAASNCCVIGPGFPSPTWRRSTLVTGSTHGLVLAAFHLFERYHES